MLITSSYLCLASRDIIAVELALVMYKKVSEIKMNVGKNEGLWFGA